MTDEATPPKKKPTGAPKRPRKPAAGGAKRPRKTPAPAQKPPETAAEPAAEMTAEPAAVESSAEAAAATGDETAVATPAAADAEATAAPSAVAEATEVLAPETADTQVQLSADAAPTEVMPSNGGTPPPFAPVPRAVPPSGGGGSRPTTLWIVLAVAAVAIVAVVLIWAFAVRDSGEQFAGNWAPVSGEGGGLVIELRDDNFEVSMYDPDLQLTGTYPAARDGDVLTFRFTDTQTGLGLLQARLTYAEDRDVLVLQLVAGGETGASLEFARVDALEAAPAPSATPTPTPTASPTASPSGSPSPTPSPTGTDAAQNDQRVADAIIAIQVGVLTWSSANSNTFPPVEEVTQSGGVGQYVTPWPTNPYTGQPMASGDQPGDYTYEQLDGGQGYELVGHLANGATYTVP